MPNPRQAHREHPYPVDLERRQPTNISRVCDRSQLAGWDGIILSDTFSIRQYCGHVNFTKSVAVNDATIAVGGAVPVQVQAVENHGPGMGAASAGQQIPPDIANIPNLVSPPAHATD